MSTSSREGQRLWGASPTPVELNEFLFLHRNTVAAACGSFVSTIAGFPLDSVKSRLQVKRYSSVLDCVNKTYSAEGVRGFFRGVWVPLLTITLVRTSSFTIYSKVKEGLVRREILLGKHLASTAALGFLGGASSGVMLSIGTSAFEYNKIRMQLEYLIAVKQGVVYEPKGTFRGFREIYGAGGIKGLYTGFRLHAARDTLGTGLYFAFYDAGRYLVARHGSSAPIQVPQVVTTFLCGSLAGIASWGFIYPVDLVKAKVQRNALAAAPYESPWSIYRRLSNKGFTKLYRGLGVSATRSLFTHGFMWTVLEFVDSSRCPLLPRNHDTCLAAVPRSAMESSLRAPLDRIPPELVTVILSHLPLESLLAVSRTSRALRTHVATEPTVWSRPLHIAAVDAGVSFTASALNAPHSPDASDLLAVLPSFDLVPNLELVRLIPTLSRFFLLYKAELPRLTNDEWKEICQARFMESVMRTARERGGPSAGYWRRVFLKTINSYEHTMQTGCSVENHMCYYLVVHRKYGVSSHRMATREYHALAVFDALKVQNDVMKLQTVQINIPGMGTDVSVSAFVTIATGGHSLVNPIAMDLFSTLGLWTLNGMFIVGPVLLTASVVASPDERRLGITARSYASLNSRDLERVGIDQEWWSCRSQSKSHAIQN